MRRLLPLFLLIPLFSLAQQPDFSSAYQQHPDIPSGILEAVSWSRTHMRDIDDDELQSCSGMPLPYGVMGLFDNGENYFLENGNEVSQLSGISVEDQKADVSLQVEAYASAFETVYQAQNALSIGEKIYASLLYLSEIPTHGVVNNYARDAQIYEILQLLQDEDFAVQYGFTPYRFDIAEIFGNQNYQVLSAKKVLLPKGKVITKEGVVYNVSESRSAQYGPALWTATPSCNYSSRSGTPVSAITIHTIQGSYAGAISWAQNCNANVSYHYVIRSSDGQVTQMVLEEDKAWHVGSENPYTIGYEHEGFVSDPSWYTAALYNSSAALSRDIVASGYGIPAVRTYYGASSSSTDVLGGCTKIKGHQHYPNQTHTDPGIHWDWERYYRLINNNPTMQSITATSGNLYDSGGASNDYYHDERLFWLIQPPQTNSITLTFNSFNVEQDWDYMFIYDGNSVNSPLLGVYTGTNSPGTITSSGGSLLIEFRSDCATAAPGWEATFTTTGQDAVAPTTSVNVPSSWQTGDFTATFNDQDNAGGSGIEKSFYHVAHFNGSDWSANPGRGFYFDDFNGNNLAAPWTAQSGMWSVTNGNLVQSDESLTNTNMYMALNQTLSNNYIYHWKGKIGGSGTNRRAGLHILCSDPTATNRETSYFIWFRVDQDKIQFYKVENDDYGIPLIDIPFQVDENTWYDFKFSFDRITGKMLMYVDDELVADWTDTNPIQSGDYISFRTGHAHFEVQDLTVYRSRYPNADILVGADTTHDLRYQNQSPSIAGGRIKSITRDGADNISSVVSSLVDVDWTKPDFNTVNDGPGSDVDTIYSATVEGNWGSAVDPHSGVQHYDVAIGTSPGTDNIVSWNNQGLNQNIAHLVTNVVYGMTYYIAVKAYNNAQLDSTVISDGQKMLYSAVDLSTNVLEQIQVYPNPATDFVRIQNQEGIDLDIRVYDGNGKLVLAENKVSGDKIIDVQEWSSGVYHIAIIHDNAMVFKKLLVQ